MAIASSLGESQMILRSSLLRDVKAGGKGKEKKPGPEPVKREDKGATMREYGVNVPALANREVRLQNETLSSLTTHMSEHYRILIDLNKRIPKTNWPIGHADFFDDLADVAKSMNKNIENEADRNEIISSYLASPSKRVAAVKVIEWMLPTFQMALGADIEELARPSVNLSLEPIYTLDQNGNTVLSPGNMSDLGPWQNIKGHLHRVVPQRVWGRNQDIQSRQRVERQVWDTSRTNRDVRGSIHRSFEYRFVFRQRNPRSQESYLTLDNGRVNGVDRRFDWFQQTYLEAYFKGDARVGAPGIISKERQIVYRDMLKNMNDARIDFYLSTGKEPSRIQVNMIRFDQRTQSYRYQNASTDAYLDVEKKVGAAGTVVNASYNQLKELYEGIRIETQTQMAEVQKQVDQDKSLNKINTVISGLDRPVSAATEEELRTYVDVEAEANRKLTEYTERHTEVGNIQNLVTQVTELSGKISSEALQYDAAPDPKTGFPADSLGGMEVELRKQQSLQAVERRKLQVLQDRQRNYAEIAKGRGPNPDLLRILQDLDTAIENQQVEVDKFDAPIASAQEKIEVARAVIGDKGEGPLLTQRKELLNDIKRRSKALVDYVNANKLPVTITNVTLPNSTVIQVCDSADFEALVYNQESVRNEARLQREERAQPEVEWRQRKREVYATMQNIAAHYSDVQRRVIEADEKKLEYSPSVSVSKVDFPPAYLRMLTILHGAEVIQVGNEDVLNKAIQNLTPQMFVNILRDDFNTILGGPVIGVGDIHNSNLLGPTGNTLMDNLTPAMANKVIKELFRVAEEGTLGEVDAAYKLEVRNAKKTNASKIDFSAGTPASTNADRYVKEMYFNYSIDSADQTFAINDLTNRIRRRYGLGVSDAKAYAMEVMKRRKLLY